MLAFVCSSAVAQSTIRLASLAPQGSSFHRILLKMGQDWKAAPGGGVTLIVYPGGVMGDEVAVIKRLRVGQLQAATLTSAGIGEIDPEAKALEEIPLMYHSIAEVDYVRQHLQASIEHNMEERGFVVLAWSTLGFAKHFSKQPALLPADFLRMKMFVGENDLPEIKLLNSIGGHPVGLNWTTALQALQTGMVEEVPTLPEFALASQYNTAVTNMLDLKWAPVSGAIVVLKKTWDGLPEASRDAMRKSAVTAAADMQTAGFSEDAAAVAAMQKRGLQVHAVTPQMEAQWQKFAADVIWPKMRGTMVPADAFDQVQQLLVEYRKKSGGSGL